MLYIRNLNGIKRIIDRKLINEIRELFSKRLKKQAIEKMREVIVIAAESGDVTAIGAGFILCALIEYYFKDYASACEYLIDLVTLLQVHYTYREIWDICRDRTY